MAIIVGREFKVVVISCVHKRETRDGKEGENFGLLSNRNLLNTALTRTKLAIIAVGHAVTLWSLGKCHIMWREYIRVGKQCHNKSNHSRIMYYMRRMLLDKCNVARTVSVLSNS